MIWILFFVCTRLQIDSNGEKSKFQMQPILKTFQSKKECLDKMKADRAALRIYECEEYCVQGIKE